jgi:hypothetical protein
VASQSGGGDSRLQLYLPGAMMKRVLPQAPDYEKGKGMPFRIE